MINVSVESVGLGDVETDSNVSDVVYMHTKHSYEYGCEEVIMKITQMISITVESIVLEIADMIFGLADMVIFPMPFI